MRKKLLIFIFLLIPFNSFGQAQPDPSREFLCYYGEAVFLVRVPAGWKLDTLAAQETNLCAVMVPQGSDYHTAPALIYPNTSANPGGNLEEISKTIAENVRNKFIKNGLKAPKLKQGKEIKGNNTLALWYFDDGQPPNNWEAAAYLPHKDGLLMLVLSAYTKEGRDNAMPALEEIAKSAVIIDSVKD